MGSPERRVALLALWLAGGTLLADAGVTLRAVTYNVSALSSGLPGVVETLRGLDADVVALQEVDVGTRRSGGVDQAHALGRALGMEVAFAEAMPFDGGRYGVALLSRSTLTPLRTVHLPRLHDEEPRVALLASTRLHGVDLAVACTHLAADWHARDPARIRAVQARALQQALSDVGKPGTPVLLLGDLNATPAEGPLQILSESMTLLGTGPATYPAGGPVRALDHALLRTGRDFALTRADVRAAPSRASDHLPLVVDLVLHRVTAP